MVSKELAEYVALAKAKGAPDDVIVGILSDQGWSRKRVDAAIAGHYASMIGVPAPARTGPRESAGTDMFLHVFGGGMAICWTWSLCNLVSSFISGTLQPESNPQFHGDGIAVFLVSAPLYLLTMVALNRRLRNRIADPQDVVRHYSTGVLLAVGAISLVYQAVDGLMDIIRGRETVGSVALHFIVMLAIVGGLLAYYASWLKWEIRGEKSDVTTG